MLDIKHPFMCLFASCLFPPWTCLCMSLVCFTYSGGEWFARMSPQSAAPFYSPIRIFCWANVLGVGVQLTAFLLWNLLLASSLKKTLPSLHFSLCFKEFYKFLFYSLLHYQIDLIFISNLRLPLEFSFFAYISS